MFRKRKELERFILVADLGRLSAVAERLEVTGPALSYTIRQLEKRFSERLFERRSDRMKLTPFGAGILEPAREQLRALDSFNQAVLAARQAAREEVSADEPCVKFSLRIPRDLNTRMEAELAKLATARVDGVPVKVSKNGWILAAAREKKERQEAALRARLEEGGSQAGRRATGGAPAGD